MPPVSIAPAHLPRTTNTFASTIKLSSHLGLRTVVPYQVRSISKSGFPFKPVVDQKVRIC